MGRVINTESTAKQRNQLMRTIAEVLRRLSQKTDIDAEVKDMVSLLVFCLHEIDAGIDGSAEAWEKRDYWLKADELRQRWSWTSRMADEIQNMVFEDQWQQMPQIIAQLLPYVSDIKINKLTRKEDVWQGSYVRLMRERPPRDA
ncbi:MAG: hypothetical protein GYB67_12200 [Chloroflexi bacterium]|nr:hypothetical protein [Chloroflexota bacterium]